MDKNSKRKLVAFIVLGMICGVLAAIFGLSGENYVMLSAGIVVIASGVLLTALMIRGPKSKKST
ncbi:hypothetical protein ACIPWY_31555 [Streptomyces sp. NPDC090032]|uniref:hypothetical protein n=1 Tax=Streptomyces sp. NPDC090032 TaxID=3365925 RepID=UPI0038042E4C